jgi:hypothetical protein
LWHEGEVVRHQGLRDAIFRWLDREADGRYVLRLDEKRFAYLEVADTPLVARAMRWEGERGFLSLSDGSEEPLDRATITVDDAGLVRCLVRGKIQVRLSNSAAAVLAEKLD